MIVTSYVVGLAMLISMRQLVLRVLTEFRVVRRERDLGLGGSESTAPRTTRMTDDHEPQPRRAGRRAPDGLAWGTSRRKHRIELAADEAFDD